MSKGSGCNASATVALTWETRISAGAMLIRLRGEVPFYTVSRALNGEETELCIQIHYQIETYRSQRYYG